MDKSQERARLLAFLAAQAKKQGITQEKWAETTGFERNNISRMLNAKYSPTLDNFIALADAIGFEVVLSKKSINQHIDDEFIKPKFLVSVDKETQNIYILHRHFPSCLVHVNFESGQPRLIIADLYDDIENPHDILNMPWVDELYDFARENIF